MIRVVSFGKVSNAWRDEYIQKTKRLMPFDWKEIPIKRMPDQRTNSLLPEEAKFLETHAKDKFFLLDVEGQLMNSEKFCAWCAGSESRLLVVGPAIGFAKSFHSAAGGSLSLSPLTFTHALAQTMLAESLYRAACILKNHPFVK